MADKAPKDTSLQSTKQMLDELDALMERMLSIPVTDLGDAATQQTLPMEAAPGPSLAASLTLLQPEASPEPTRAAAPKLAPTVSTSSAAGMKPLERRPRTKPAPESIKRPKRSRSTLKLPNALALEPEPEQAWEQAPKPLTNEVVPTTIVPDLDPLLDEAGETPPASRRHDGPLVGVNQTFDNVTLYLGGIGQGLRGRTGRALIGFTGVVLLLGAVWWVLKDWLGWNWP